MAVIGRVESLWRYPVKSMRGERLEEAYLGFAGVYGDRVYAFHNSGAPKGFPYYTGREEEEMLLYQPMFRYPERMRRPLNQAEAEELGSGVTPLYAEGEETMVDVRTPAGETVAINDPRLLERLRERADAGDELKLLRSDRALTDCRPVSLFSIQTVKQLGAEVGTELDQRRFRANLYVDLAAGEGFGEDALVGRTLAIGARARVVVVGRDARCKMITLDPETGKANPEVMKALARGHEGKAGVYGAVLLEGTVRVGDAIEVVGNW